MPIVAKSTTRRDRLLWLPIGVLPIGVLLFSGYICYDTYMIATRMGPGDEVIAALELYLDIINLFLLKEKLKHISLSL